MSTATEPSLDDVLAPLRSHPEATGIVADYDGTLAPIVEDPGAARPLDGIVELLDGLVGVYARVAVVSGRPVGFLEGLVPSGVTTAGLYGLEVLSDGVRRDHPQGGAWREVIDDVAAHADAAGPRGMLVERKGLSLTLHYRARPELEDEVQRWADTESRRSGLVARPARMSVELHPPIDVDKGTALLEVADGLRAVCFIGDDVGDLPAFDALDQLAEQGVAVLRVAVRGSEAVPALLARADLVLDGPAAVKDLLERLLPAPVAEAEA
jgi:trehalose 6-phosphate phosphatase